MAGIASCTDAVYEIMEACGQTPPEGHEAYVTGISVSTMTDGLAEMELSLKLIKSNSVKPKRKAKSPWVSCRSKQRPMHDNAVLVVTKSGQVSLAVCNEDGDFWLADYSKQVRPTHWTEIPEHENLVAC